MCYGTETYTVFRHIRASFSPEISQAGAVKGVRGRGGRGNGKGWELEHTDKTGRVELCSSLFVLYL